MNVKLCELGVEISAAHLKAEKPVLSTNFPVRCTYFNLNLGYFMVIKALQF